MQSTSPPSASTLPFPSHADLCGWNAMLPPRLPKPAARGNISAKYAVVGAGYTGVAAARRLSELDPGADIVVLEATTVGEGASARNSGFISPSDIAAGLSPHEIARSEAQNRLNTEGFDWLVELIQRYGIACDLERSGRIKAAATSRGERAVLALRDIARGLPLPHALLDRQEIARRTGSSYYAAGLYTEEGYLVQPAALIRGLADSLPTRVQLFEQSPVLELGKSRAWHLTTPDAQITADTLILATNAAIKQFGYLRDRIVTIHTYAAISAPVPEADRSALGSMTAWGILPAHRLGTTVRRVGIDRLMVRSLYSYERALPADHARAELSVRFRRRFPELSHVGLDTVWGGTTALTLNGAPFYGRLDDGLYAFAGCNGAGVVKGTVLGKRLAEEIVRKRPYGDIAAGYGTANWMAPEPFRAIGFRFVSAIERRRAGLES